MDDNIFTKEHIITVEMTQENKEAMEKIFEEAEKQEGWQSTNDYISIYMPRSEIEFALPLIKTVNICDTKSKEVLLSANTQPKVGCFLCKDIEDSDELRLCYSIGLDYGVLYEDIDDINFCPVCGRKLPKSEG